MNNKTEIAIKALVFLIFSSLITSCCVLKAKPEYQTSGSFACAQFGGADSNESGDLPALQIGGFLVLDAAACAQGASTEFTLSPGILFSRKGNERSFEETGGDGMEEYSYKERTRTTYLDIPVVARVPVYKGLSIYAGPQTSILLGAKTITESNGQKNTTKNKDGFNKVDFGLSMGVGYELKNGLSFGLGYDHGLSNVYKSDYGSSNIKNRFYKGTIGLNINKFKNR